MNGMNNRRFIYTTPGEAPRRSRRRFCFKCKISNSPSWRSGPNGEKLCNKCGLQYRRGLKPAVHNSSSDPGSSLPSTFVECRPQVGFDDWGHGTVTNESSIPLADQSSSRELFWHISQNTPSLTHPSDSLTQTGMALDDSYMPVSQTCPSADLPQATIENPQCTNNSQEHSVLESTARSHSYEQVTNNEYPSSFSVLSSPQQSTIDDTIVSRTHACGDDPISTSASNVSDNPVMPVFPTSAFTCPSPLVIIRQRMTASDPATPPFHLPSSGGEPSAPNNQISDSLGIQLQEVSQTSDDDISRFLVHDAVCTSTHHAEEIQCTCPSCLQRVFTGNQGIHLTGPCHDLETFLVTFYRRAAEAHIAALQRQSSIYVVTETSICQVAGDHLLVTAFGVLRQNLELNHSQSGHYPALMALGCDLEFDYLVTGTASSPTTLDDWLHGQSLIKLLSSERSKSAIWDMSRLPPGPHRQDSRTFRWLQRTLLPLETGAGPQIAMNVQSGSDEHQFRKMHAVLALIKHVDAPHCLELYAALEPRLQDASIESCQEWFIAVLDEAAKIASPESQLEFLDATNQYMLDCIEVYMLTFHEMNIHACLHLCSPHCAFHVQPSFQSLRDAARDALRRLFSLPESLLPSHDSTYPTEAQLFHARVIGLTQFKLYFSYLLLTREEKVKHSQFSRAGLANARILLAERTQRHDHPKLIWNYLPVGVAQRAAVKLARATNTFSLSPTVHRQQADILPVIG